MARWLIKSAIQRAISMLPNSRACNEWFQENVTHSLGLSPGAFETGLNYGRRFLDDFLKVHPERAGDFTALELGTGWYPVVPIVLYLCGAKEIWSFDITPLLRDSRLKTLVKYFCEYDESGRLRQLLPGMLPQRMVALRENARHLDHDTPEAFLKRLNLHVFVQDAQHTSLPANSVDLFFSTSVLEYIPAAVQHGLYTEFHRVGTPAATVMAFINLKDQFSMMDRSISPFNCLQYSSGAWKWLNSPLIPQTRLRISDYREALVKSGWVIVKENSTSAPPAQLDRVKLAPEFQKYSREDLLVIDTWLVARSGV